MTKKKATIYLSIVIGLAILISADAFLWHTSAKISSGHQKSTVRLTQTDSRQSDPNNRKQNNDETLPHPTMNKAPKGISHSHVNISHEENLPNLGPEETREELIRLAEMHKKLNPIYFKLAPVVLEQMFDSQSKNHSWTSETAIQVRQLLQHPTLRNVNLLGVNCGASLCKIQFECPESAMDTLKQQWLGSPIPFGDQQSKMEKDESGFTKTTIYLSRQGDSATFKTMRSQMLARVDANY